MCRYIAIAASAAVFAASVLAAPPSGGGGGGGATKTAVNPLLVVDANGKTVGRYDFEPNSGFAWVYFTVGSVLAKAPLVSDVQAGNPVLRWFNANDSEAFYYESADCSGTAYLSISASSGVRRASTAKVGSTTLLSAPGTAVAAQLMGNSYRQGGSCFAQQGGFIIFNPAPVIEVDITLTWAEPFTVQ